MLTLVGGYSLLLHFQRGGARSAGGKGLEELPPEPVSRGPLPRILPVVEASGEMSPNPGEGELVVTVQGPAGGELLGVAILDGWDGKPLAFQALDRGSLPAELEFSGIPEGEQLVCLVRAADQARHGYLDRATVEISPAGTPARTTLSARVQDVKIKLICPTNPALVTRTLHELTRADDPDWRPPRGPLPSFLVDPMLMTDSEGVLHLRDLGPGRYALALTGMTLASGVETAAFLFQVPGPEELEITCRPR